MIEEAERWVLNWGNHTIVVGPRALGKRLARLGQEYLRRYELVGS